jgi:hypothetical protein
MPNKQTHVTIGTLAGGGLAAYRAREQEPLNMLLEAIGGGIGGYIGGRLPDVIEPASWPSHRQLAHSAVTGIGIGVGGYKLLEHWEEWCRSAAERYRREKEQRTLSSIEEFFYILIDVVLHIAAGAMNGLVAGYLSHLTLDMSTKKGIPLLQ